MELKSLYYLLFYLTAVIIVYLGSNMHVNLSIIYYIIFVTELLINIPPIELRRVAMVTVAMLEFVSK